jgi:hypothetical protein
MTEDLLRKWSMDMLVHMMPEDKPDLIQMLHIKKK